MNRRNQRVRPRGPFINSRVRSANKLQNNGAAPKGSADPRRIKLTPWWQVTLNLEKSLPGHSVTSFNLDDLNASLQAVLGLSTAPTYDYRIIRCDVWGKGSSVGLRVSDMSSNANLYELKDTDSKNHFPHIHYIWPKSISAFSIGSSAAALFKVINYDSQAQDVIVYLQVMWRPRPSNPTFQADASWISSTPSPSTKGVCEEVQTLKSSLSASLLNLHEQFLSSEGVTTLV